MICREKVAIVEALNTNIVEFIREISADMLEKVFQNIGPFES